MILDDLTRALLRLVDAQNALLAALTEKSVHTYHHSLMRAVKARTADVEALTHGKRDEGVWR